MFVVAVILLLLLLLRVSEEEVDGELDSDDFVVCLEEDDEEADVVSVNFVMTGVEEGDLNATIFGCSSMESASNTASLGLGMRWWVLGLSEFD